MKAITENWSTYTDNVTGARFLPYLDKVSGLYVGLADVTEEQAESLKDRGFQIYSAEEFAELQAEVAKAIEEAEQAAAHEQSGDPLADAVHKAKPSRKKKDADGASDGDKQGEGADDANGALLPPAPPASGSGE